MPRTTSSPTGETRPRAGAEQAASAGPCDAGNPRTGGRYGPPSVASAVRAVQALLYRWPGPADADSARRTGTGTCAAKHALLREELTNLGVACRRLMVVGPLAPPLWPDLVVEADGLLEVHECLTIETEWAGPLLVDVTWHPAAVRAGLAGTLDWDGLSDMRCAVDVVDAYAVGDSEFREQKERLRARLYSTADRARRDGVLAEIARRARAL